MMMNLIITLMTIHTVSCSSYFRDVDELCYGPSDGCQPIANTTVPAEHEDFNLILREVISLGTTTIKYECVSQEDHSLSISRFISKDFIFHMSDACSMCLEKRCVGSGTLNDFYDSLNITEEETSCSCTENALSYKYMTSESDTWDQTEMETVEVGFKTIQRRAFEWPILTSFNQEEYLQENDQTIKKRYDDYNYNIRFEQPYVKVITNFYDMLSVTLNKNEKSDLFRCNLDSCIKELDDSWFTEPGKLIVKVYKEVEFVKEASFDVVIIKNCDIPNCVVCGDFFMNFGCLPSSHQAFYIASAIIISFLLLMTLLLCFYLLRHLYRLEMSKKLQSINVNLPTINTKDSVTLMMIGLVIFMPSFVPIAAACDNSFSIDSSHMTCTRSLTREVCQVEYETLVTLFHPGNKICFDIINTERNAKVGDIQIRYVEARVVNNLEFMYWTSNWSPVYFSKKVCRWGDKCDSSQDCSRSFTSSPYTMFGAITGATTLLPGQSSCQDSCGCAGCDCVSCDSACTYGRWAIKPGNSTWKILRPGLNLLRPRLEICVGTTANTPRACTLSTISSTGNPISLHQNYSVTVLGSLSGSEIAFDNKKIAVTHDVLNANFVDAAETGFPEIGRPGDIQASTEAAFTSPSRSSFIYPGNMVSNFITNGQIKYNFPTAGIRVTNSIVNLPTVLNGILWAYSGDGTLSGVHPDPGTLMFTIKSNSPATFTRVINEVCPEMTFSKVIGYYTSSKGAKINLDAKSKCLEGSCVLSTTASYISILTPTLQLTEDFKSFEVNVLSSKEEVDFELDCTSGNHKHTIHVYGILELDSDIGGNPGEEVGGTGNFEKWFGDLDIGAKVGFIIGLSAAAIIILLILSVAMWYITHKVENPYEKILREDDEFRKNVNDSSDMEMTDEYN